MVLLPLLMRMCLCHCHDGIVALITLAPLPTLHGRCHPCCAGVVVLIALTSLPSHHMGVTQRPKRRNFERDSYKMALKIAPDKKFLLNVQPELRQAIGEKSCTNSTICTQSILWYKRKISSIHEIEIFSL
jgi:hypothetical protein